MVSIKDLIDELGGGRSLALGSVLVVCCYVVTDRYVETVEARLGDYAQRIKELEAAKQRLEGYEAARREFQRFHPGTTVDSTGADEE